MSSASFAINTSGRKELACPLYRLNSLEQSAAGRNSKTLEKSVLRSTARRAPKDVEISLINSTLDLQLPLCHLAPAAFAASDCAKSATTFARSVEYARA
jgi:hypothetical protein